MHRRTFCQEPTALALDCIPNLPVIAQRGTSEFTAHSGASLYRHLPQTQSIATITGQKTDQMMNIELHLIVLYYPVSPCFFDHHHRDTADREAFGYRSLPRGVASCLDRPSLIEALSSGDKSANQHQPTPPPSSSFVPESTDVPMVMGRQGPKSSHDLDNCNHEVGIQCQARLF